MWFFQLWKVFREPRRWQDWSVAWREKERRASYLKVKRRTAKRRKTQGVKETWRRGKAVTDEEDSWRGKGESQEIAVAWLSQGEKLNWTSIEGRATENWITKKLEDEWRNVK